MAFTDAGAAPVTKTKTLAGTKPGADALIVAEPRLNADICGCVAGKVDPAGMKTTAGLMVIFDRSLLESVTLTPPAGAGLPN